MKLFTKKKKYYNVYLTFKKTVCIKTEGYSAKEATTNALNEFKLTDSNNILILDMIEEEELNEVKTNS